MLGRVGRLIFIALIVLAAVYLVIINGDAATVRLLPGRQFTANTGVVLLVAFAGGIACTTIVGLYLALKAWIREKRLLAKERQRRQFYDGMLRARARLAAQEWAKARDEWEELIKRDPTDIIARVELSRCLQGAGQPREALRILEAARAAEPNNLEVLFRAAELNEALGNKTAAIDNLALILTREPNAHAARMARDLSEDLGRIDDALEYQSRLEQLGGAPADEDDSLTRLRFAAVLKECSGDDAKLAAKLPEFIKKNPGHLAALEQLAELSQRRADIDGATQALIKAGKASGRAEYWQHAAQLWSSHGQPERALAAARAGTKDTRGLERLRAECNLTRTLLSLNMLEDSRRSSDLYDRIIESEQITPDHETQALMIALRGLCYSRLGDTREALRVWSALTEPKARVNGAARPISSDPTQAPSPTLSTP